MSEDLSPDALVVLVPVYDDYAAFARLLGGLEQALAPLQRPVTILVVDDGSASVPDLEWQPSTTAPIALRLLRLRRNLGHQRAIAIGLAFVHEQVPCSAVLVMDGDGEDRPEDVPRLIDAFERRGRTQIVFAERTRRSEHVLFQVGYQVYRGLHWALTGIAVRFGNFSIVPRAQLSSLVVASELWNHYAAAVLKTRLAYGTIHTTRGSRYAGRSHLNFVALVVHGLSAISVFGDVIGVRLLIASAALMVPLVAAIAWVLSSHVAGQVAVPGWALASTVMLSLILCQALLTSCMVVVFVLGSRASTSFIPLRDYRWFVADVSTPHAARPEHERLFVSGD